MSLADFERFLRNLAAAATVKDGAQDAEITAAQINGEETKGVGSILFECCNYEVS